VRNRHIKGVNIYLDEHVPAEIKAPFQEMKLRTLEIAKTRKYAGRDELDYIHELLSENAIFVTSDLEFIKRVVERDVKHAGIVHIPEDEDKEEKIAFAWVAAGVIRGLLEKPAMSLHDIIIYSHHDGLHFLKKGKDSLIISYDMPI
jgi:hypothetical protein